MKLNTTLMWMLAFAFPASMAAQNSDLLFSPKGIAEIHITLSNGKQIGDIKNEKNDKDYAGKLEGTVQVKNSKTSSYTSVDFYNGKILIEGRGNTTWGVPKRPYNIDLVADDGSENPAPLLDMPANDEWSLLAFWHDRSLMRIPMAMYIGHHLNGIQWTPRMQYVELWINGDYRGLYCLSEKVQRGDDRINIKKLTDAPEDQVEPRISGGYILEASTPGKLNELEQEVQFQSNSGINFTFKYPKPKNVTQAQRTWIKNYINEMESVLNDNNKFKDPVSGYQKYLDVPSFIDWTILHEQSKGVDNLFHASIFVHKDRNGKLKMSAPWDFDLSYGNAGDFKETGNMVRTHRWFDRLSKDDAYMKLYKDRLNELTPFFNQIPEILNANYKQLEDAGVVAREEEKWPQILWEYNNGSGLGTPLFHKAHVRYLSDWIQSRDAWCYMALGADDKEKGDRLKQTKPVIRVMDPEAFDEAGRFDVRVMEGYKYIWNDGSESTGNGRRINSKGKYWVKIKDNSGNVSLASDTLYVGVAPPTSISVLATGSFDYAYITNGQLNVRYFATENGYLQIQLFDIKGIKFLNRSVALTSGANTIEYPVAYLKPGIYILQLTTGKESITKKEVVN